MTRVRWDLEWRGTLLTCLLFPTLIALGFWQLDRADEKAAIAARYAQRATEQPLLLQTALEMPGSELAYRNIRLSGAFEPEKTLFLDNQIRDGRYGHDVVNLFRDEASGEYVLLNRGWVPGDPSRRSLPETDIPVGVRELVVQAYVSPGERYQLAEESFDGRDWPLLVQSVSSKALFERLRLELGTAPFPVELRLWPDQRDGFRRDWPVVNVSTQKHQAYAVQWFTMAAALMLFFIFRSSNLMSLLRYGGQPTKQSEALETGTDDERSHNGDARR